MLRHSQQDDIFAQLATFSETTCTYLILVAIKRRLTEDETWLLDRAAKAAGMLTA
jgi:hypothetical protein